MKKVFFLFIICSVIVAKSQNCNKINKKYDKFENETIYTTELTRETPVVFSKFISENDTVYYVTFFVFDKEPGIKCEGVWIIFDNDTRINRKYQEVNYDYENGLYSAIFRLDSYEYNRFKDGIITDYRLCEKDKALIPQSGKKLHDCFMALTELK